MNEYRTVAMWLRLLRCHMCMQVHHWLPRWGGRGRKVCENEYCRQTSSCKTAPGAFSTPALAIQAQKDVAARRIRPAPVLVIWVRGMATVRGLKLCWAAHLGRNRAHYCFGLDVILFNARLAEAACALTVGLLEGSTPHKRLHRRWSQCFAYWGLGKYRSRQLVPGRQSASLERLLFLSRVSDQY